VLKDMKVEFGEIFSEVIGYLAQAWITVNPLLKWLGAIFAYVLFPKEIYATYAMIVAGMVIADLVTKYYSIAVTNGGLWNAIKTGKLSSNSMWVGTRKKIVSYFLIMILVGLTYRFEMLQAPAEFLGTLAYSVMFFREGQSIIENMMDAGHNDLRWLYFALKRKKTQALETVGLDEQEIKEADTNEENRE
jgi:phage-related holin